MATVDPYADVKGLEPDRSVLDHIVRETGLPVPDPDEARDILESKCVIPYAPAHKSDGGEQFRVHGSDVTITVYRACAQDLVGAWAQKAGRAIPNTEDTPPEPLQQRLFGEK